MIVFLKKCVFLTEEYETILALFPIVGCMSSVFSGLVNRLADSALSWLIHNFPCMLPLSINTVAVVQR